MNTYSQIDEHIPIAGQGNGSVYSHHAALAQPNGCGYDPNCSEFRGNGYGCAIGDSEGDGFCDDTTITLTSTDPDLWICWDAERDLSK